MNNRYQLIRPIISNKIYESSSMIKSAKKCYQEVKNAKIVGATTFTIKDIDSHKTFTFQIHNKNMQYGGEGEVAPTVEPTIPPAEVVDATVPVVHVIQDEKNKELLANIKELESNIKKIDMRIGILEQIINPPQTAESQNGCQNAYMKNIQRLQQNPTKDETCCMM